MSRNMERIISYIVNKVSDLFPPLGGAVGAISQVDPSEKISHLPSHEVIISTIIVAALGATVGYMIKLLFDLIFRNLKEKYKIKND